MGKSEVVYQILYFLRVKPIYLSYPYNSSPSFVGMDNYFVPCILNIDKGIKKLKLNQLEETRNKIIQENCELSLTFYDFLLNFLKEYYVT